MWPTTTGLSDRHNVFIRDITERNHLQDELLAMAFSDAPIRAWANRALASGSARRCKARARCKRRRLLVVLVLDVDATSRPSTIAWPRRWRSAVVHHLRAAAGLCAAGGHRGAVRW